MGVAEGADIGDKVKKNRPRGAARGAAAGRYRSLVFGGSGGRSPPDFCYLDNIEITEANRQTLLFYAARNAKFYYFMLLYDFSKIFEKVLTSTYTYGILYL